MMNIIGPIWQWLCFNVDTIIACWQLRKRG